MGRVSSRFRSRSRSSSGSGGIRWNPWYCPTSSNSPSPSGTRSGSTLNAVDEYGFRFKSRIRARSLAELVGKSEEPYNPEVIVEKYPDEATVIPGGFRNRRNHVKTPTEKILDSYRQHDCEKALQIVLFTMRLHPNRKCSDDGRECKFGEDDCTDYHHYRDTLKRFCAIEVLKKGEENSSSSS